MRYFMMGDKYYKTGAEECSKGERKGRVIDWLFR
jgi:hypothetical protein